MMFPVLKIMHFPAHCSDIQETASFNVSMKRKKPVKDRLGQQSQMKAKGREKM